MGLLDKLFGKSAPPAPPPPPADEGAPGWDAIDAALARIYGPQKPKHLANGGVRWMHDLSGKANPLDGVHVFDAGSFWHYIGLGLTELYGKESKRREVSGLGYELTFRLGKQPGESLPPVWPLDLLNGLGRPAMLGKLVLDAGHTLQTGPLAAEGDGEQYVGVLVHEDPALPAIETPNGRVRFLQLVPVDAETLARAKGGNAEVTLAELARRDPELVLRLAAP
jgi:hypothetical protein